MTTDVDALITRLRFDANDVRNCHSSTIANRIEGAADTLRSQAERIQALEAKCALLAASLAQEEKQSTELERDARRYRWLRRQAIAIKQYAGGNPNWEIDWRLRGETFEAAVDAAIAAQAGSKEG